MNIEVIKETRKYNYVLLVYVDDNLEAYFSKSDIDLLDYAELRKFENYKIFELVGK